MRTLDTLKSEGFVSEIIEWKDGRVEFDADADIDADGANGQVGQRAAYRVGNTGSEDLANGGMGIRNGRVVGITDWFRDIVIVDEDGQPKVFQNGVIASKTSYRFPGVPLDNPKAYVDSETVPYVVVPPIIIQATRGVVMGCRAFAWNLEDRNRVEGIVADVGPRTKSGELSIAMARLLRIDPNPRSGGAENKMIRYEIWPGVHGQINGTPIALQRSTGGYIMP